LGKLNPQDVISDQDIHSKENGIEKKKETYMSIKKVQNSTQQPILTSTRAPNLFPSLDILLLKW
jgi:hypothetical protein